MSRRLSTTTVQNHNPLTGYAVIVSSNFMYCLNDTTLTLGRQSIDPNIKPSTSSFLPISNEKNISRQHVVLTYDTNTSRWSVQINGKNGAYINNRHVTPNDGKIVVHHKDRIKVGDVTMFFICKPLN